MPATKNKKDSADDYDFEKALKELESLVDRMEQGDLSLEDSLQSFEQGIKLTRECQTMLAKAEQRVQKLIQTEQGPELQPFDDQDTEA